MPFALPPPFGQSGRPLPVAAVAHVAGGAGEARAGQRLRARSTSRASPARGRRASPWPLVLAPSKTSASATPGAGVDRHVPQRRRAEDERAAALPPVRRTESITRPSASSDDDPLAAGPAASRERSTRMPAASAADVEREAALAAHRDVGVADAQVGRVLGVDGARRRRSSDRDAAQRDVRARASIALSPGTSPSESTVTSSSVDPLPLRPMTKPRRTSTGPWPKSICSRLPVLTTRSRRSVRFVAPGRRPDRRTLRVRRSVMTEPTAGSADWPAPSIVRFASCGVGEIDARVRARSEDDRVRLRGQPRGGDRGGEVPGR